MISVSMNTLKLNYQSRVKKKIMLKKIKELHEFRRNRGKKNDTRHKTVCVVRGGGRGEPHPDTQKTYADDTSHTHFVDP